MRRRLKVAVSLHNLSSSHDELRQAGIQRVVFNVFRQLLVSAERAVELVPVLRLPLGNPAGTPHFRPTHFNASEVVLDEVFLRLGVTRREMVARWPYLGALFDGSAAENYEQRCIQEIAACDVFFEVALADVRNVVDAARQLNPRLITGICVHDMAPMIMPEYVNEHIESWFGQQFLACLHSQNFFIAVSRHTALDLRKYLVGRRPASQQCFYTGLPSAEEPLRSSPDLPAESPWQGLSGRRYLVSVATLEPRKNLRFLISGFLRYLELFPEAAATSALVLVGGTGWKTSELAAGLEAHIGKSIIFTGFVSDVELSQIYAHATGMAMVSHYEGFGLPLAEALQRRLPAITCANSSLPEASGLAARYVKPWAVDELACAIGGLLRPAASAMPDHSRAFDNPLDFDTGGSQFSSLDWRQLFQHWLDVFTRVAQAGEGRVLRGVLDQESAG